MFGLIFFFAPAWHEAHLLLSLGELVFPSGEAPKFNVAEINMITANIETISKIKLLYFKSIVR